MLLFMSLFFPLYSFVSGCLFLQQVDDKYIRTIHLHSSGGSGSGGSGSAGGGKNSHRAKTLTNSQSRDRHDSNGSSRARTLASQFSQSSAGRGEYFHVSKFL